VIGYRLLPPAEEEMAEAALFYELATAKNAFERTVALHGPRRVAARASRSAAQLGL
jgi:hypothetical protein